MSSVINLEDLTYVIATYATEKFLSSMRAWIITNMQHKSILKNAVLRVFIGADVPDDVLRQIRELWPAVQFERVPSAPPENSFADYWAAEHYAYKIWIMKRLVDEYAGNSDAVVIYHDAGTIMTRMPVDMIVNSLRLGVCFVEDNTQKNIYWMQETFRRRLEVSESELSANQVCAGTTVLYPLKAGQLIAKAYELSCIREVIAGPKWAGVGPDGRPFGHRHDQSIFSLLRLRYDMPTILIDKAHSMKSLAHANKEGRYFYVHRGNILVDGGTDDSSEPAVTSASSSPSGEEKQPEEKRPEEKQPEEKRPEEKQPEVPVPPPAPTPVQQKKPLQGVDDIMVINLARRKDRLDKFVANHPELEGLVAVHEAVDGRALQLTPAIARLLRPNDFFWKKPIAGCALSHLGLWYKLANDPNANSYLILEDDVKLVNGWMEAWNREFTNAPADWDVLYLGGILPSNWAMVDRIAERVSGQWCRIALNQLFGQSVPTRYFHFCTYSYVISKRGAQKLLGLLAARDGIFTSADHFMCNQFHLLNYYFTHPRFSGCTQEDDPRYLNSVFNDYNRVDNFDSDIWTNDERWSLEERNSTLQASGPLSVEAALLDIQQQNRAPLTIRLFPYSDDCSETIFEFQWLQELFGRKIHTKPMPKTSEGFEANETPIIMLWGAEVAKWRPIFQAFMNEGRQFYAIHMSDEFCHDPIDWYNMPNCKGILRFYNRPDIPCLDKVIVLPLGYTNNTKITQKMPREFVWSFHGTKWFNREPIMNFLKQIGPHNCTMYDEWLSKEQKSRQEYACILAKSHFIPCARGNNYETFRFYEALEAGSIPLYVGDDPFYKWITQNVPLLPMNTWNDAIQYIIFFMKNPEHMEKYRAGIQEAWANYKITMKGRIASLFHLI